MAAIKINFMLFETENRDWRILKLLCATVRVLLYLIIVL
jgi:hypothetical protein